MRQDFPNVLIYTMLRPLVLKNFLTAARGSHGSKIFQKLYFTDGKKTKDILKNGDLSCAFFVSSLLKIFSLIGNVHATVDGTIKDMANSGWEKINRPIPGAVVVWGPKETEDGTVHRHIGICLGNNKAISNRAEKRTPVIHALKYRMIEGYFWNKNLG